MTDKAPAATRGTANSGDLITDRLRSLMQAQGLTSFRALALAAGISEGQILQLRRGKASQMRLAALQKLATALALNLTELLDLASIQKQPPSPERPASASGGELKAEYERLQQQLTEQEAELRQGFQQAALYQLETWMKNWPKVVHAVQTDRPDLAAAKVIPLLKPLEQLLKSWDVETIGCIGKPLPYDPQAHQLGQGQAQPGETVTVTRPGYRQGDRLLHRAEVCIPDRFGSFGSLR